MNNVISYFKELRAYKWLLRLFMARSVSLFTAMTMYLLWMQSTFLNVAQHQDHYVCFHCGLCIIYYASQRLLSGVPQMHFTNYTQPSRTSIEPICFSLYLVIACHMASYAKYFQLDWNRYINGQNFRSYFGGRLHVPM